jgi:Tetratricopeptide repeat
MNALGFTAKKIRSPLHVLTVFAPREVERKAIENVCARAGFAAVPTDSILGSMLIRIAMERGIPQHNHRWVSVWSIQGEADEITYGPHDRPECVERVVSHLRSSVHLGMVTGSQSFDLADESALSYSVGERWEELAALSEKRFFSDPQDVDALLLLAQARLHLNQLDAAEEAARSAAATSDPNGAAHAILGRILQVAGRHPEAVQVCREALRRAPTAYAAAETGVYSAATCDDVESTELFWRALIQSGRDPLNDAMKAVPSQE